MSAQPGLLWMAARSGRKISNTQASADRVEASQYFDGSLPTIAGSRGWTVSPHGRQTERQDLLRSAGGCARCRSEGQQRVNPERGELLFTARVDLGGGKTARALWIHSNSSLGAGKQIFC